MALILKSVIFIGIISTPAYNYNIPTEQRNQTYLMPEERSGQEQIDDDCEQYGVCTHIPDYPREAVAKLIAEFEDKDLDKYRINTIDEDDFQHKVAELETSLNLCKSKVKFRPVEGLKDRNNNLHMILTGEDSKGNKLVPIRTEICINPESSECSYVSFNPGYDGGCFQQYSYQVVPTVVRKPNGGKLEIVYKEVKLPSYCSCLANANEQTNDE